jgi:DMSO reductase family type II enzyme chaperone
MDELSSARPMRSIFGRDDRDRATLRCVAYAACSELLGSPHDFDARAELAQRASGLELVPGGRALARLIPEFVAADRDRLRAEYSVLFEVGSQGPPVPIREDLQTGQRAGTREEVVRFYDYFGYALSEKFAWQPDHLSVELEFMHFLCFHEAQAVDAEAAAPYQLAQRDFSERHLVRWLPGFAAAVAGLAGTSLYARTVGAVRDFVVADADWQADTIASGVDR